ncbi:uncharacterized protein LAJ45_02228 [Morchella importuna]|uniref:NAD(P)-binding protein n=1 Tax=Morchella conica CCBAS932 TaxID=1392247 RepID=A0A3N4KRT5_9PEZI|nr:uncharacterized protein LAJ45_02228 [Morchella importuna]KAH8153416.1 hypothetical protein LAJ45_02228 [Morchella importuna]RPB13217.1 NAD(P)-binding protein [Morchella conica CCBAS932]
MAPKVFATGASGYIGGAALDAIINAHPDYEITALVRSPQKVASLVAKYPNLKTVNGDLDSGSVIESETEKADIILHFADCDHVLAAKSISAGLKKKTTPVFLIHTSGSAILPDISKGEFGQQVDEKIYDDIESIKEITSFPIEGHVHRDVDTIILGANSDNVKTAIVCPPTIYGVGAGTAGNTRSNQVPGLTKFTLQRGETFQVNAGKSYWNNVHIDDLSQLYLLLTEDAAAGGKKATWGTEGYYFAENGEHVWGELAKKIAEKAKVKGYLRTNDVASLNDDEIKKIHPFGCVIWGTNSRGRASRARKVLGWTPKGASLEETLDALIDSEAKSLGITPPGETVV